MNTVPLMLFNSLTRATEPFVPSDPARVRVYSCGPTVYNYQHIGNMRAYVFADTLGRVLRFKGYAVDHVVNITDVGHLTSDADTGDDKLEQAASASGTSAWDIAAFYQADFENDLKRLNTQPFSHPRATDYVAAMIDWAKAIEAGHCYRLDSGLYFDISTVPDYGRLARVVTDAGQSRLDPVPGKRNPQDFAIWRTTPPGETRQMEWDSPWGRGAPGWHLECSVMSRDLLGMPFDIHTGGIDHREIHHPCEIAQNQAHEHSADPGARLWMHNNFLIDRTGKDAKGKMSKSSGEFLRLQTLVDRGFHPLAYRLMCLQAHYRSEMEFTWEGLAAAQTRLKRLVIAVNSFLPRLTYAAHFSYADVVSKKDYFINELGSALFDDLNTSKALTVLEAALSTPEIFPEDRLPILQLFDACLGLDLCNIERADLRIRPTTATLSEADIEGRLDERKAARAAKHFARSDAIRDELAAAGVEVMDGDPLGWDWKIMLD